MGSKGFSLLEALIAIAILSVASFMILNYQNYYVTDDSSLLRACQAQADKVISAVQEETYYRAMNDFLPINGTRAQTSSPPYYFSPTTAVPNAGDYIYGNSNYDSISVPMGGDSPILHNEMLIQGSLRSLVAIYNRQMGAVGCKYGTYTALTSLPLNSMLSDLTPAPTVQLRLEPYDASTGGSLCSQGKLIPRPKGYTDADRNVFAVNSAVYPSAQHNLYSLETTGPYEIDGPSQRIAQTGLSGAVTEDVGMIMSVQVNYTYKGQSQTCTSTQKFEYPADLSQPPPPDTAKVTVNGSLPGPARAIRDYCVMGSNDPTASATIQLGYSATATHETATQLLCKDLSWIREPKVMIPCQIKSIGSSYGAQPYEPTSASFFTNSSPSAPGPYAYDFNADIGKRTKYWQVCDQLTQCGRPPTPTKAGNLLYNLSYTKLPPGCVMDFEVVGVDSAGNRSSIASKRFIDEPGTAVTSTAFSTKNFTAHYDEIYYPQCGDTSYGVNYYRSGLGYYCGSLNPAYKYYRCGQHC